MQSLSVAIFVISLATGFAASTGNGTDNKVQDLVDAYLGYQKGLYVKLDPVKLKDGPTLPIVTLVPPVAILLTAVNRTVSGISESSVSGEVVANNTAQLRLTFPVIRLQSDYKVGGLFLARRISGAGHATIALNNVTVDVTVTVRNQNVRWPLRNASYLQIAELNENVRVGSVSSNYTGLTVDGLTTEEVTKILNDQVTQVLDLNLPFWSRLASAHVQCKLNLALVGSSIDDAINWLKTNTPQQSHIQSLVPDISGFLPL